MKKYQLVIYRRDKENKKDVLVNDLITNELDLLKGYYNTLNGLNGGKITANNYFSDGTITDLVIKFIRPESIYTYSYKLIK